MKRLIAVVPIAVLVAGCAGGSSSGSATPAPSQAALTTPTSATPASLASVSGCDLGALPKHYAVDKAHTGKLTARTYSAAADVQAALEYDHLTSGARSVFLHRTGGAHSPIDGVVSCVAMDFTSAHLAGRFFMSYRALRAQAKSIVHELTPEKPVNGLTGTTSYFEKDQSFRGYGINSTNVIEVAGQSANRLYITSVAGTAPSVALARTLLESMASQS
jgi:hypothetical protein